jgi:hypothetical protein
MNKKTSWYEITDNEYNQNILSVGVDAEDSAPTCNFLTIAFKGIYARFKLPLIIKPIITKVTATSWDEETIKRLGRNYYINYTSKKYGFALTNTSIIIKYGAETNDSLTDKSKCYSFPWAKYKFIGQTLLNSDGTVYKVLPHNTKWEETRAATESVEKTVFLFKDYDGEEIEASCYMEEREWSKGDLWCSWLKYFFKNTVRRTLDLTFSNEVGSGKGSWKGGTVGHSVEILQGETYENAFKRYCLENRLEFLRKVK